MFASGPGEVLLIVYAERRHWAEDNISYHRLRADQELEVAQYAKCPVSRRFHYHLAALHLDRAYSETPFSNRNSVESAAAFSRAA
jgi:hypothetical protein